MQDFMNVAIEQAKQAFKKDEVPVGAVIVYRDKILAQACNERESSHDPTAHAEIIAIREVAEKRDNWRFEDCEIYVTKEPCPMCAGAIQQARFAKLIYGCKDEKAGYAGSLHNILQDQRLPHQVEVVSGVEEDKCRRLLQDFFRKKRI